MISGSLPVRGVCGYNGIFETQIHPAMNRWHSFLMVLLAGIALMAVGPDEAYAKRLGGGKSFGGRPSYSESYRTSPNLAPNSRAPQAVSPAPQRNQALRDSFRNRGGLMGILGGLALGGLLGAMLFGGAFEHINLFDLLVLGLAAYLLFRLFSARRRGEWSASQAGAGGSAYPTGGNGSHDTIHERGHRAAAGGARFDTDVLSRDLGTSGSGSTQGAGAATMRQTPADFDAVAFLTGAKNAYRHLQAAWDEGDLAELRALTTPSVFDELRQQLQQRSGANHTEVLALSATLLDVQQTGSETRASVLLEALLRENADEQPAERREVWHFVRDPSSRQPTWFLDGIQQSAE